MPVTTTPNPIDSLPPTDERVGMPRRGDGAVCEGCGRKGHVFPAGKKPIVCGRCGSYDITGHGVASLRGVQT